MNELITVTTSEQGSLVVSSLDFALGLDINHKSLVETIRTHQTAIEESFGLIAFETVKMDEKDSPFQTANLSTGKRSTKPLTVAYLTEDQAMFIGTLSRNSKRVVEFKATLVKSFAQARQRLQAPVSSTEQALLQLMAQSNQLMATQQQMMTELRADVDELRSNRPAPAPLPPHARPPHARPGQGASTPGQQLGVPGIPIPRPPVASLRQMIHLYVSDYSAYYGKPVHETYSYLYKRMWDIYGISVHRLNRQPTESLLDVLERYGQLNNLYALVTAELIYPHE